MAIPIGSMSYAAAAAAFLFLSLLLITSWRGRLPGMLVLGAEDPHQFKPTQGTDLLAFFAGIFERTMRRWLS